MKKEFGDFQTPLELCEKVVEKISKYNLENKWSRVLEPTCGKGNFIQTIFNRKENKIEEILGFDIQEKYVNEVNEKYKNSIVKIKQQDIFKLDFSKLQSNWQTNGSLLIIGNPPWVTNSEIGKLSGTNLPKKMNENNSGFGALTGSSNFDLGTKIIQNLIDYFITQNFTTAIALLCKTTTSRFILEYVKKNQYKITEIIQWNIDAKKWFNVSVDACLFLIILNGKNYIDYEMKIFESLDSEIPEKTIKFEEDNLVYDSVMYKNLSHIEFCGKKQEYEWRSGLKHDLSEVMELSIKDNKLYNKNEKEINIEFERCYPLLKSTDVYRNNPVSKMVIVTQKKLNEDTTIISKTNPLLWEYLKSNKEFFEARKSKIYVNKPQFSIFGIGSYSFEPYKIAISGLHKEIKFRFVKPFENKPVMFDDTCYILSFSDIVEAAVIYELLNLKECHDFLKSIITINSKRPITKKVLKRINIKELTKYIDSDFIDRVINLDVQIKKENINLFINKIKN